MAPTIDKAGRIVIPKAIRSAARLEPGTKVRFQVVSGRIEMEPVPLTVRIKKQGHLGVAVPPPGQPVLTESAVEDTVTGIRNAEIEMNPS